MIGIFFIIKCDYDLEKSNKDVIKKIYYKK